MKSVLVLVLAIPAFSNACTCSWTGPFLTVAPRADLVVRAKVLGYTGKSRGVDLSMFVEVRDVLAGWTPARRLRIWGDNGAQCRAYVSGFPVGSEWILAVHHLRGQRGRRAEYEIRFCGEYWAKVESDQAVGRLTALTQPSVNDVPQRMSLSEVKRRLKR